MNQHQKSSKTIYIQLTIVIISLLLVIAWQKDFFFNLYMGENQSRIGLIINLAIIGLFALGITRVCILLDFYQNELDQINSFSDSVLSHQDRTPDLYEHSLVLQRYRAFEQSKILKSPVNHSALASVSVAQESSRLGFPKFVNNVLILTGVFGTIVSLSIALLGASDMIGSTTQIGGLGTVIQGMSSALSTTMTAIIVFFIFSYFYQSLTDLQTNCISRLEYVTTTQIVPMFHTEPEAMIKDYSDLITSLSGAVMQLKEQHDQFLHTNLGIEKSLNELSTRMAHSADGFERIIALLGEGFRLSDREK